MSDKPNYPVRYKQAIDYSSKYWKNKPVTKFNTHCYTTGIIDPLIKEKKPYCLSEPITIPESLKWITTNTQNVDYVKKLSQFLNKNYHIGSKNILFCNFTIEYILHIVGNGTILLLVSNSGDIYGSIVSTVHNLTTFEKTGNFADYKLLCVHSSLRNKNIACLLMNEMSRILVQSGINSGYSMGYGCCPTPITTLRHYWRPFNYKKLKNNSVLEIEGSVESMHNKFKINSDFINKDNNKIIKMTDEHILSVHKLYNQYKSIHSITINYSVEELQKMLLNSFVTSYVFLNDNNEVIDFVSWYTLDNIVNPKHKQQSEVIKSGHLYLYSCNKSIVDLYNNIFMLMSLDNVDLLSITDMSYNGETLSTHIVDAGEDSDIDSYTKSYLFMFIKSKYRTYLNFYNWKCTTIDPKQLFLLF
jgi:hypothetical protein